MFIEVHTENFSEIVFALISTLFFLGHNLWLVAKDETNETVIEVVTSDTFPKSESAVKPERIADFRAFTQNKSVEITEYKHEGNSLVAKLKSDEQPQIIALELYPHPIVLEAEKFARYIESEAAQNSVAPQFVAGETQKTQRESYAKFAKVLLDNKSFDKIIGQKFEIVLLSNPSLIKPGEKLKFKVLFDGAPAQNLRISVGAEHLNGGDYAAHALTDENGIAELEISEKGLWFARTHLIRPHFDPEQYDWESFWTSVTFRV
jgi:ABC-type Co2+ transport system, periplasmic component